MWKLVVHLPDRYLVGMILWLCLLALIPYLLLKWRRKWRSNAVRLRFVKAGLGVWCTVGFLTAIELGFALFYDTTDSFDMTNVSRRWNEVHVQPDIKLLAFKTDEGYKYRDDVHYPLDPPETATHLLFLGDSFTFGHGIPDVRNRFTNLLRAGLDGDARTSGKFVVSNLSTPGGDFIWSEALLRQLFADRRRVDVAIHVMCLNDIETFHEQFMDFNEEIDRLRSVPPTFLLRETYFFNWAYFRCRLLARQDVRNYYSFVKDYYSGPAWMKLLKKWEQLSDLCRQNESRFVLVIFPFLHNLGADYPFQEVHERIAVACRERGIVCLDLLPVLRAQANKGLTVNSFDAHPNERAQRIVADELRRQIDLLSP
jgi:hypothetical protein